VFSKNRDRLLTSAVAQQFFAEVSRQAKRFMSDEHFTVDGTLIQSWASQKSFRTKDGSDDAALGLCHQPEPEVAGREGLRLAETDRTDLASEVSWTGNGGLDLRL
jgi:hypothetical protein